MQRACFAVACAMLLAVTAAVAQSDSKSKATTGTIAGDATAVSPLGVGDTAPSVTVRDSAGDPVALADVFGAQPTALVVYRGGWCPFCNKHFKELADVADELKAAGYQLVAISADRPEAVAKAEENADHGFRLLSDADLDAAKAFGLAFKLDDRTVKRYAGYGIPLKNMAGEDRYALPVPAFYLIDENATVEYVFYDPDYKVRISADEIREQIDS